ncbi:UNVERIFIED_CONTAM: movement protein, partial [Sesamum indicum]
IKIAATTLELDKENFIKLVELSLEGSVKIGWDNTPEDTKASILAGDSKGAIADRLGRLIKIHFIGDGYFEGSRAEKAREYAQALFSLELRSICAVDEYIYWFRKYFFQSGVATEVAAPMFFAKICSPWREMLIQSYKVPEGQLDSVARRMSFLKDKLKDWCYQASIQKNMKRLRGKIKRTPLCCDNNDFPTIIGESSEPKKRKKQNNDSYTRSSRRTFSRRRSWWSKSKARTYKSGQRTGPTRVSSQGSRRTDARSTGRTPTRRTFRRAHTRANESFKDCNCWTCGAKGHISPDCPQKRDELRKFEATDDILDAVYYGDLVPIYQFEDLPSDESVYEEEIETDSDGSSTDPYDGFRIGGIGKVLNQIGLNQRKHHIIYKVSSGEFAIPMELTGNVMEMQLIPKEEILEELSKLREEVAITMKWIHIGTIEVVIKATFKEGIDSEIHLSIMDRRINNLRDGCLGTMIGNLYAGKLMFDIHPRIAYNLADQDFSRVLTLHQDFKRKDLMREGNRPYSITYRIAYALSNTHHSDLFLRKEYIEIPRIFKEFAKVMTRDPIRIPRIGGVDIIIKDHPILDRTLNSRTEFNSRMSFSEDRIIGYKGKEKELQKALTPQEIRVDNVKLRCPEGWKEIQQPVVGKYEGMLEIAGHEILVAGVAGRENGSMTLGLSFLEDHKPWGRKAYIDSGSGICTAKPGVFPKEARETLPVIAGRGFSQKILILNKGIREAKIMIGGAFGSPWFRVKTPPIYFHDTGADILLGNNFIQTFARYMQDNQRNLLIFTTNCGSEIQDKRKFGKVLLSFRQQGLIDSDSFYKKSEEEILNLKEALLGIKALDISEESRLSRENVKRLIQRNFSENPLAWWDRNKIEATLKMIIKEHISLGLIEPGISTYSSPGFLVRNHGEIKR